jgi:hypothetical protein
VNTAHRYPAEDVTGGVFQCGESIVATGIWNFNAATPTDHLTLVGTQGDITTSVFDDVDVMVATGAGTKTYRVRNPPHVHQPLVQRIVDALRTGGAAEPTGATGARTAWAMDQCVASYRAGSRAM